MSIQWSQWGWNYRYILNIYKYKDYNTILSVFLTICPCNVFQNKYVFTRNTKLMQVLNPSTCGCTTTFRGELSLQYLQKMEHCVLNRVSDMLPSFSNSKKLNCSSRFFYFAWKLWKTKKNKFDSSKASETLGLAVPRYLNQFSTRWTCQQKQKYTFSLSHHIYGAQAKSLLFGVY